MPAGFIGSVAAAFGDALRPLADALTSEEEFSRLLARHGWESPAGSFDIVEVQQLIDVQAEFAQFASLMEQAADADLVQAGLLVRDAIDELKSVLDKVTQLASRGADGNLPFPFALAEFWAEFPGELIETLFVDYLEGHQRSIAGPMVFLGVIEHVEVSPNGNGRIDYLRSTLRWERLPELLQPQVLVETLFLAETGQLLARRLIDTVAIAFLVEGLQGVLVEPDASLVDAYYTTDNPARDDLAMVLLPLVGGEPDGGLPFGLGLTVLPIPPAGEPDGAPSGVAIGPAVTGAPADVDLGPFSVELSGGFLDDRGLQLELRAAGITVAPALGEGVFAELKIANGPSEPVVLIGSRDGDRLQAQSISLVARAEGTAHGVDLRFGIAFDGVAMVFDTAAADEFTTTVAGADQQQIGFSTGLTWSSRHGLTFRGQLALESHIPVTARLGPVAFDSATLSLATSDGALTFAAGGNGRGRFGPLTIVVNGLGLTLDVRPVGAGGPLGNFGVLDVDWSFRPPRGYGLELAVSDTIHGGGFLERDDANGRWVGAIDLAIDRFRFSGLVISERDSLIGVLWFQGLKIPLFGGVITGLGVVVAYHRRSDRDAFLAGLKSGALEALMFPADPVA